MQTRKEDITNSRNAFLICGYFLYRNRPTGTRSVEDSVNWHGNRILRCVELLLIKTKEINKLKKNFKKEDKNNLPVYKSTILPNNESEKIFFLNCARAQDLGFNLPFC